MRDISDTHSRCQDARADEKNVFNIVIISLTLILMVVFSLLAVKFSTVFYILISGVCGVAVYLIGNIGKEKSNDIS